MKIVHSPSAAARFCRALPRPLVFVPTMGALHEGHITLVRHARKLAGAGGTVAVSIFVNPAQFGPKEDFSRYPRPLARDTALCREAGSDVLFAPAPAAMYAQDASVWIDETLLSTGLCGVARPGHFRGVCTVVAKLFNIIGPDSAVFGKKDAQQLAIIRRMVRDLNIPVKIIGAETVREPDGLAMSSRNRYLSQEERAQAPVLRKALLEAAATVKAGGAPRTTAAVLARRIRKTIGSVPLAVIDYVEAVDAETLAVPGPKTRRLLLALAAFFGKTRLIDNLEIALP